MYTLNTDNYTRRDYVKLRRALRIALDSMSCPVGRTCDNCTHYNACTDLLNLELAITLEYNDKYHDEIMHDLRAQCK